MLRRRDRLSKEEIRSHSEIIKDKLFHDPHFKKAACVMFYVAFGSEVDTRSMIIDALERKKVAVPVMQNKKIIAALIQSFADLKQHGEYGILEPADPIEVKKDKIDVVIVPGVTFDRQNHRIGYGKGYYDDFLRDFKGVKIGIAFDMQVLEAFPHRDWDVQLDKVIVG